MRRLIVLIGLLASGSIAVSPVATAVTPFPNCTAARDAGYTDIPSSSPYYGPWLDGDSDGVACES